MLTTSMNVVVEYYHKMAFNVRGLVSSLLCRFPPTELVFAYGSAALQQHGRDKVLHKKF